MRMVRTRYITMLLGLALFVAYATTGCERQADTERQQPAAQPRTGEGTGGQTGRPVQPARPAEPGQPGEPAQPAQPDRPVQPAEPAQPAQPGEPAEPAQPAQPAQPAPATQPGGEPMNGADTQ